MKKMEREWDLKLQPLPDVSDGWLFVFVTGIMGFASLAFPTHMR